MTPAEVVGRSPDSGMPREQGGTTDHQIRPLSPLQNVALIFFFLAKPRAKPPKNSSSSAPHAQAQPGEPGQPQPNPYPTP